MYIKKPIVRKISFFLKDSKRVVSLISKKVKLGKRHSATHERKQTFFHLCQKNLVLDITNVARFDRRPEGEKNNAALVRPLKYHSLKFIL
jgi:hypothetical protein